MSELIGYKSLQLPSLLSFPCIGDFRGSLLITVVLPLVSPQGPAMLVNHGRDLQNVFSVM